MTTITISDASFTVSGKLVAGDTILVRLDNVGLQENARVRIVITAIPPPDARHLVAATGLLSSAKLETQLLLKSTELRNALKGAHVSEAVPVMIEAIDEAHACVLGALRYQILNSAALWIGSAQKYPIPDPIYALSEDLKRHESDRSNPHAVTASQVGADASGTAAAKVAAHDESKAAHADIRSAVAKAQSAAARAIAAAQTVDVALSAHANDNANPHAVTEAQVAEASTDDADKAFGRLDSVNIWAQSQAVKPTTISDPISDESTIKSSNVVHLTAVDGGAPSCFLSGIGKSVPSGAIAEVMIVCDNTTAEDQSFTIFFDYGRTISRLFRSDNPMPYNTFSGVPPNGLCIVKVLFWNKRDGDKITIVRDVWRSDWKDDGTNSTMAPMIFDGDGGAWKLLATGDGGMYTIPV